MKEKYDESIFHQANCNVIKHPNYRHLIRSHFDNNILDNDKVNIILLGRQAILMFPKISQLNLSIYGNINFTVVYPGGTIQSNNNLMVIDKKLNFDDYYSLISYADFSLFASDESIENRASGILMDCISLRCPVIFPEVGHFLEYKEFGIGFSFESYNDLEDIFQNINENFIKRSIFERKFDRALDYSSTKGLKIFDSIIH